VTVFLKEKAAAMIMLLMSQKNTFFHAAFLKKKLLIPLSLSQTYYSCGLQRFSVKGKPPLRSKESPP